MTTPYLSTWEFHSTSGTLIKVNRRTFKVFKLQVLFSEFLNQLPPELSQRIQTTIECWSILQHLHILRKAFEKRSKEVE